jgi:hypothetical protein
VLLAPRVRAQLSAQRGGADVVFDDKGNRVGGAMLLAVVTLKDGEQGRRYRLPTERDYAAVRAAQHAVAKLPDGAVPDEPLPPIGSLGFRVQRYGMMQWGDLFTARQKLLLATLVEKIHRWTAETGREQTIKALLAIVVNRCADYATSLCSWHLTGEKVNHTFGRQALPMFWDFTEVNVWADASGNFDGAFGWVARVAETNAAVLPTSGQIEPADACASPLPDESCSIWFTDPPYYDAVPYADLSDFFFVWLKRTLPDHSLLRVPFDSQNPLTPKAAEIVQDEIQQVNGGVKDRDFFEREMGRAFAQGRRVLREDGVGCVVFAHKTTEGWEALLTGILRAGWTITASWPITTEMGSRLRARDSAALSASVHLVCRPRPADASVGDWGDILRALPRRIREWMESLNSEGIRGADLVFSCIGPALELFSQYRRVETPDGEEVTLAGNPNAHSEAAQRGFLSYVWEIVGRAALQQVLGGDGNGGTVGALEEDARLTALFLWTLQSTEIRNGVNGQQKNGEETDDEDDDENEDERKPKKGGLRLPFDVVRRFAQPLGIHLNDWERRTIETEKGVVRLLPIAERAQALFGEGGATAVAQAFEETRKRSDQLTMVEALFPEERPRTAPNVRPTRRQRRSKAEDLRPRREATTLDRIHAAMLLQASGAANALRALLTEEQQRGPDFLRLANALSALYPSNSEEKRLLDAMLLAMPK